MSMLIFLLFIYLFLDEHPCLVGWFVCFTKVPSQKYRKRHIPSLNLKKMTRLKNFSVFYFLGEVICYDRNEANKVKSYPTHSPGPDSYIGRKRTEKINISIRHLIKIKLKNSVISQEFKYNVCVSLFLQERWQKDGRMLTVRDKTWNVKKGHVFQPVAISRKLSI